MPSGNSRYSMVVATTFEQESMGRGSVAVRLAKVKAAPLENRGANSSVSKRLTWNGQKTSQWIKVFRDDDPDATADTLLATPAGKVSMISEGIQILEIWDLASGTNGYSLDPMKFKVISCG